MSHEADSAVERVPSVWSSSDQERFQRMGVGGGQWGFSKKNTILNQF